MSGIRRKRRLILIIAVLLLASLYMYRVYQVNNSPLLEYVPRVQEYSMGQDVSIPSGFYNRGYLDQTGYYINVTDSGMYRIDDLYELGFISEDAQKYIETIINDEWIIIVSATFHFEGNGDPLVGVIDMSDYKLVGPDYYIDCSTELNELAIFNQFLAGSSAFSIGSGKDIEVQIPFLIDEDSPQAIKPDFIINHKLSLLLSRYPDETYVVLNI